MTLTSIIQFVLGIQVEPESHRLMAAREYWRDAVHANRNEATKAIATAVQARRVSDEALKTLNQTIERQEAAQSSALATRLRAFSDRLRGNDDF